MAVEWWCQYFESDCLLAAVGFVFVMLSWRGASLLWVRWMALLWNIRMYMGLSISTSSSDWMFRFDRGRERYFFMKIFEYLFYSINRLIIVRSNIVNPKIINYLPHPNPLHLHHIVEVLSNFAGLGIRIS